jgi:hypothetical protein
MRKRSLQEEEEEGDNVRWFLQAIQPNGATDEWEDGKREGLV